MVKDAQVALGVLTRLDAHTRVLLNRKTLMAYMNSFTRVSLTILSRTMPFLNGGMPFRGRNVVHIIFYSTQHDFDVRGLSEAVVKITAVL